MGIYKQQQQQQQQQKPTTDERFCFVSPSSLFHFLRRSLIQINAVVNNQWGRWLRMTAILTDGQNEQEDSEAQFHHDDSFSACGNSANYTINETV